MSSSLSKYIGAAQQHVEELKQSLTEDDLRELHQDVTEIGERDWHLWRVENRLQIEEYLLATPAGRTRRKAWQDQSLRLRLTYAAILYAQESERVLSVLHQSCWIECASVAGYRDMTASAAGLYWKMFDQIDDANHWPFSGMEAPY